MQTFWWYEESAIAGMGRPGFNAADVTTLPFAESAIFGWAGLFADETSSLADFHRHLDIYVPKMFKFIRMTDEQGLALTKPLYERAAFLEALENFNRRFKAFATIEVSGDEIHFIACKDQIQREIDFLKKNEIKRVVTLTEQHHNRELMGESFRTHHLSIEDLGSPSSQQVHELAEIIRDARASKEKIAVHCLAGIGRTSTMLMGASMVLGETLESLKARIAKQNPRFVLAGSQQAFLESFKAN